MVGGICLGAPAAHADDAEPIRIAYDAPASCPSKDAFVAELRARTTRAAVVDEGERRVFEVTVTTLPSGAVRGILNVRTNARSATRNLEGGGCDEVVSGL